MEMTEVFERLKKLQDVLVQKYEIEAEIEEAPGRHSKDNELLQRQKQEYINLGKEYEKVKDTVQNLKAQLEETESKREAAEKNMDSITTQREYELLSKEISDAELAAQQLRKDLQKEESVLDDLDESMKTAEETIKEQDEYLRASQEQLASDIAEKRVRLEELSKEEGLLIPDLDPEMVFKFERIIKSKNKNGVDKEGGIVAVKGNVCNGCHMILPSQFANEVRKGESVLFCPYCSRVLYYLEGSETENIEDMPLPDEENNQEVDDFLDDDDETETTEDLSMMEEE